MSSWSFLLLEEYNLNSNVRKNILLSWVSSIIVTNPHSTVISARNISNNICVNELTNEPEVDCTNIFTTEKAGMGYIVAIIN